MGLEVCTSKGGFTSHDISIRSVTFVFYSQHGSMKYIYGYRCKTRLKSGKQGSVLAAVNIKMTGLWNATPCSLGESYQRFGGTCCINPQRRRSSWK
jgi:hypothetical protein